MQLKIDLTKLIFGLMRSKEDYNYLKEICVNFFLLKKMSKEDEIKIYTSQDENYTIEPPFYVIDLPDDQGFLILKESER